jgi:thioredoxin
MPFSIPFSIRKRMKLDEFNQRINTTPRPLIIDLWAPWCGPCRAMEPAFQQVSQKYAGQVDVVKINADDSPEVLSSLGVMGIPTVLGYAGGRQILRRTGMQSAEALDILFDAVLHQRQPAILPPAPADRIIRTAAGAALLILGWLTSHSWIIMAIGAVVLFTAFYDRCPIFRAVYPRIKALFNR